MAVTHTPYRKFPPPTHHIENSYPSLLIFFIEGKLEQDNKTISPSPSAIIAWAGAPLPALRIVGHVTPLRANTGWWELEAYGKLSF